MSTSCSISGRAINSLISALSSIQLNSLWFFYYSLITYTYNVMPMHVHFETAQGLRRKGYTVESLPSVEEFSKETSVEPVGEGTVVVEELVEEYSVR